MTTKQDNLKVASTAGLLLMDAMIFQEIVATKYSEVPTLAESSSNTNLKKQLEETWAHIMEEIDYVPVLDIALRILKTIPASPISNNAIKSLVNVAYFISSSKVLLRHDLFGRVYHTLLLGDLVKYYATYYTSIPAARLLSRLLVADESSVKFENDIPLYNGNPMKIVDFACGSGTLLSAMYKDIDSRYRNESQNPSLEQLHKYLIERGMWGFDVLRHAIHLAGTALSVHNPYPVEDSNLYTLKLGDGIYLGSPDFLRSRDFSQAVLSDKKSGKPTKFSLKNEGETRLSIPDFDICIMNPPFSRSVGGNLLFGSLPKSERRVLQERLSALLKEKSLEGIGQAGLAAVIVAVGDLYLKEGGKMGLVLPRAVLSGVSWQKVRDFLLEKYDVEYLITSYEGAKEWNFSENTHLSEILLEVRKRTSKGKNSWTFFVNLWKKPKNEIESVHLATLLSGISGNGKMYDIENSNASPYVLKLAGRKVGEVYSAKLKDNFGIFNFFSQMELNRVAVLMRNGVIYLPEQGVNTNKIKMTELKELVVDIGPDRSQIHHVFKEASLYENHYKAIWGYEPTNLLAISQEPNKSLEIKKSTKSARDLWTKAGNLLIVERIRLNTYPVMAIYLDKPVLSNVFWPIVTSEETAKILAVWLNSTLGFVSALSSAEVTEGPWVAFKKEELWKLPVLDVNFLTQPQKKSFLKLYNKISTESFQSPPDEFKNPMIRKRIDAQVLKILGISLDLKELYRLLSKEPMITG